ncbi:hypothetical protein HETIRDRAFT_59801 [Heterobasidion irregulare TC 32-1]|uniref:BTB domain-containing protein n=1 Tax=Heterobasidion irregulare (strain TC 32-1) TaxID=747525 RepID=W4KQF1_HETIT|nr:uncharacterized protein HETIRDRAFT_59801 [Heterobasidion irregulare TC 32-1]ETW87630.1 hypothetical protein HETIRDRAFT_59801 [Heterobasidion irregulare TC 32-1]
MNPSGPSSTDIQAHLYNSFLEGKAADVVLNVDGFVESTNKRNTSNRHQDQIDIVFNDTNITRAAFEYAHVHRLCIARLYGGGPQLFIDAIIPTPAQPLTASFLNQLPTAEVPAGQQPATPRFLMSLLAASIYLSIPSVASQALTSILSSVGPLTVVPYLKFAIGQGIGPPQEDDLEAAVGLEQKEDPADALSDSEDSGHSSQTHLSEPDVNTLCFYYGAVSDKIGEAAACWLARWGADMLGYEQQSTNRRKSDSQSVAPASGQSSGRRSTMPSSWNYVGLDLNKPSPPVVPVLWRKDGLDAKWVRALVSSDSFFVRGERERYDLAKAIVEMRRNEGTDEKEEAEFTKMFSEGIYYANMLLDDLVYISRDISPTNGRAYVPIHVIQVAHWSQSLLQHTITARPTASPTSSPGLLNHRDELGISVSQSDIVTRLSSPLQDTERNQPYWPIPNDSSLRIGDNTGIEGASMDELFSRSLGSKRAAIVDTSESTFFGLKNDRCVAADLVQRNLNDPSHRFLPHPPFRFAVEFWDVEALREKSRLHSQTIWYAGNLFNVYVQLVRKKGIQLGVYLHRQSNIDPIPPPSAPFGVHLPEQSTKTHTRSPSSPPAIHPSVSTPTIHHSPPGHPMLSPIRSMTPTASSPASSPPPKLPATASPVAPVQPYRDPRSAVSAYFTISCASATGSSLTRFTSAPDVFKVSQSWGWKSSSLRTEEYLEVVGNSVETIPIPSEKEVSLRVTIILGIV